jgi:hypothetical protein
MTVTVTTDYRQWFKVYTDIFKLTAVLTTEIQVDFQDLYPKIWLDRYRNYRLQTVIRSAYWNFWVDRGSNYRLQAPFRGTYQKFWFSEFFRIFKFSKFFYRFQVCAQLNIKYKPLNSSHIYYGNTYIKITPPPPKGVLGSFPNPTKGVCLQIFDLERAVYALRCRNGYKLVGCTVWHVLTAK